MSQRFDWQSEEDYNWVVSPVASQAVPGRRSWLKRLFILIALGVILFAVRQHTQQRVDNATATVEAEVLATHEVIRRAAAQSDVELVRAMLAGHVPAWVADQERLLVEGLFLDRVSFGLSLQPAAGAGEDGALEVWVAPDMQSAEVVITQAYTVDEVEPGAAETVHLRQTAVYRRDDSGWRLASPEPDFWGEWITRKDRLLTLIYPERDQEVAARLAADLKAVLVQICADLVDIRCPSEFRLILRLETDPAALAATTVPIRLTIARNGLRRLTLPAPTLVGLPADEAGYQALYRGYAAQLTVAIDNYLAEWACCVPFQ